MKALLCAIGFCLVFEGLFPMIAPENWKKALREVQRIPSDKIRLIGFVSVVLGLIIVQSVNMFF